MSEKPKVIILETEPQNYNEKWKFSIYDVSQYVDDADNKYFFNKDQFMYYMDAFEPCKGNLLETIFDVNYDDAEEKALRYCVKHNSLVYKVEEKIVESVEKNPVFYDYEGLC
ncbi:hypothetical protein SPSIL_052530 [Sporomusa silvacetica DSM 10669]|uniref:Phage protein n=1 Tax=Sporomusa silvacetica DSM 10669 TaxID=1123289 RepID=A0ABZ3ITH6_9FIRM|nr:hypothetical protein [Sporomusa silvacetica]OZC19656.1 hypothetical protein SPSIL_20860 [Sporomusa silvacetica DSM 10669]